MGKITGRILVGRPINGITLNGLEYLSDNEGEKMLFRSKEEAVKFLKEHGYSDCMIEDGIVFEERDVTAETSSIVRAISALHENCKKLFCDECPARIPTAIGYRCSLTEYTPDHWDENNIIEEYNHEAD